MQVVRPAHVHLVAIWIHQIVPNIFATVIFPEAVHRQPFYLLRAGGGGGILSWGAGAFSRGEERKIGVLGEELGATKPLERFALAHNGTYLQDGPIAARHWGIKRMKRG